MVWVWNVRVSLFFPALPLNAFFFFLSFSPCVAHCTLSLVTTSTPPNTGVRKEDETRGNVREASFNKALKYYLKLKDIHTCLKSSPPLSSSLLLSTVAGVGWFPWWLSDFSFRCGRLTALTEKFATSHTRRGLWLRRAPVFFLSLEREKKVCVDWF